MKTLLAILVSFCVVLGTLLLILFGLLAPKTVDKLLRGLA